MRILIVEDDKTLSRIIRDLLETNGYVTDAAHDISSGHDKAVNQTYDALLLDVMLPDGNGMELCSQLRNEGVHAPIIMLTGRSSTQDTIGGLDSGADDYIVKPFKPSELIARLRAVLRRPQQTFHEELTCGDITLSVASHSVTRNGKEIELMPKEYSLLEYLIRNKNVAVKKEELLRHVWGIYSRTSSNRLEVYIRYLREKLDIPFNKNSIQTVRGLGYKLSDS